MECTVCYEVRPEPTSCKVCHNHVCAKCVKEMRKQNVSSDLPLKCPSCNDHTFAECRRTPQRLSASTSRLSYIINTIEMNTSVPVSVNDLPYINQQRLRVSEIVHSTTAHMDEATAAEEYAKVMDNFDQLFALGN